MDRLCLIRMLTGLVSGTFAQAPRLVGGAGFFRIGYANLHRFGQIVDLFTPVTGVGNDFV